MGEQPLTIDDAIFIFPTDFIQSVAVQEIGELSSWTTKDHLHSLFIEAFRGDNQLRLAIKCLKLCLRDGLYVCSIEDLERSSKHVKFSSLSQIKDSVFHHDNIPAPQQKKENGDFNQPPPKRKRGRPKKSEAEKNKPKIKEVVDQSNNDENVERRYTLRGVKLSAEIMNAEKGIYKEKSEKQGIRSSAESNENITSDSNCAEISNSVADELQNEIEAGQEEVRNLMNSDVDSNIRSVAMSQDGDSDDDFIPQKKRKRGRPRLLQRRETDIKTRKRGIIDIGNVPKFERRKRNNDKREACKLCKKRFCDYTGLFNHVKVRHTKAECFQSYMDELRELMVAACEECGAKFANRNLLFAHEDREHRQKAIVECFKCNKSFRNIMNLKHHMKAVHIMKGDKSKLCHLCPAKFKWAATLKQHIDEIHEGNKHAKCRFCDKMFYSNSQLRRHERCHGLHQSKFAVCQQCGHKFLFNHNLKRHMETMHGSRQEIFHCSYCGRGYNTKTSMVAHVQLVHFNLFSYNCKQCSAAFPRSKFLVDHMLAVHKVDNYKVTENPKERYKYKNNSEATFYCSYCNEGFHYKAKMVNHIHTDHADVFPHRCDRCNQGFLELSFLNNHKLKAHGIRSADEETTVTDEVPQDLNCDSNTELVATSYGSSEEVTSAITMTEGENSQTMAVIETEGHISSETRPEPLMSDRAAASLLVEVASGNKTYQYCIQTQEGVGEDGVVTLNPQDIASVLMMAEQTIQAESGSVVDNSFLVDGHNSKVVHSEEIGVGSTNKVEVVHSQEMHDFIINTTYVEGLTVGQETDTNQSYEAVMIDDSNKNTEIEIVDTNNIKEGTNSQAADLSMSESVRNVGMHAAEQEQSEIGFVINMS